MPRRTGPQERPSGFEAQRDRLPRSIALRLARAGLMASGAPSHQAELPLAAGDGDHRDDRATTSPGALER